MITTNNDYSETVRNIYLLLLDRMPDDEGLFNSIDMLNKGENEATLISLIANSDEFKNRMNGAKNGLLWNNIVKLQADITVYPNILGHGIKLTGPSVDQSVFRAILDSSGLYEEHIISILHNELKPGHTFLDIGANLGYFSVLAGKIVGPKGSVISFEPSPINFQYLIKNTQDNQTPVTLHNLGVWHEPTTLKFETAKWSLGSSHILFNGERSDLPDTEIEIKCVPIDELSIPTIHVMKMDIEGAEPFALRGMEKTILKHKPIIIMEINRYCLRKFFNSDADDIFSILQKWGYTWESIDGNLDIPEDGICDIIAKPSF